MSGMGCCSCLWLEVIVVCETVDDTSLKLLPAGEEALLPSGKMEELVDVAMLD